MKQRVLSAVILSVIVAGITVFQVASPSAEGIAKDSFFEYGKILHEQAERNTDFRSDNIALRGSSVSISIDDLKEVYAYYRSVCASESNAFDQSIRYNEEYYSLYAKAISEGYKVTEEEACKYVSELKNTLYSKNTDPSELKQYKEIISSFDSEDEYWDYTVKCYMKALPIQKMNADMEKSYLSKHPDATSDDFSAYYEKFKDQLVEKQDFKKARGFAKKEVTSVWRSDY
ncbi:MAG: hypothetical protein PUF90_06090 [Lachnospiraceae bacterium]|nr:hypothetical protein [Lachnospiraceae bacterium]